MTVSSDLQKLLIWLSPAFPVGAFAWSAGLETAIAQGLVFDRLTTQHWVTGNLEHGSIRTDAILLAHAYRNAQSKEALRDLVDFALALTPAYERHQETLDTGAAFAAAAAAWPADTLANLPQPCPYPIAVGALAAGHQIDLGATLLAYSTATVHGQVSVAVRLVPIGQTDGLRIMATLEPAIGSLVASWLRATLDDIGSVAYAADIAQMAHETQTTRIFRS
jgi:urease accessory protein